MFCISSKTFNFETNLLLTFLFSVHLYIYWMYKYSQDFESSHSKADEAQACSEIGGKDWSNVEVVVV